MTRQNLYKGLKKRLDIIKDKPTLPMFVEYQARRRPSIRPGAVPVHCGPIRIIQKLQREAHNPIILVLPTMEVDYNTMDAPLRRSKQAYLESARELATMCDALGVPFVPLAVHDLELDNVLMRGKGHRPAFPLGPAGRAPLRAAEAGHPQADPGVGCSGPGHPGIP